HNPVAPSSPRPAAEVIPDDLLRMPPRVDVRRVDEIPPTLQIRRDQLHRPLRRTPEPPLLSERHGPQAQRADTKPGPSERDVVIKRHGSPPCIGATRACIVGPARARGLPTWRATFES